MGNWFGIFSDSTPINTETNTQQTGSGGAMDDVGVFIPDGEEKTFGEMTPAEKAGYSHRAKALTALRAELGLS